MGSKKLSEKRKYFRLWDILVISLVLMVALFSILSMIAKNSGSQLKAVITIDGRVWSEVELSEVTTPYDLSVPSYDGEGHVVVHIEKDFVCVLSSPCKDKLCVNTGKLTKASQSSVCLPERVSVKLVASSRSNENLPDAVVG